MTERLIINVSTGATTTVALTSEEIAEREAIAVENAKVLYKQKRTVGAGVSVYPGMAEQLDQLYRDVAAGKFGADAKTGEWFVGITSVKTLNPKP
tara:strand:- start:41 stop:325 length:285 start_codon:yes stop_codon:yes gene_type:complete